MQTKQIIQDGRTLKAMARQEDFQYPVDKPFHYVDELNNFSLRTKGFVYKGSHYVIEYQSGCFYPYVCKVIV